LPRRPRPPLPCHAVGTRTIAESNLPPDMDVPTLRLRLDTGLGTVKVYRT
jgi:hypothetical protein